MSDVQIMLADENAEEREKFQDHLADTRFQVTSEASDGREALDQFHPVKHDLAAISLGLPVGDVMEGEQGIVRFVKQFREEYQNSVVLVSYTTDTKFLVRKARDEGAVGKIKKPYEKNRLLESLVRAENLEKGDIPLFDNPLYLDRRFSLCYKNDPDAFFSFLKGFSSVIASHLCPDGVQFVAEDALQVDDELEMKMDLPCFQDNLGCRGTVAETIPAPGSDFPRVNVQFDNISEGTRNTLKQYIIHSLAGLSS